MLLQRFRLLFYGEQLGIFASYNNQSTTSHSLLLTGTLCFRLGSGKPCSLTPFRKQLTWVLRKAEERLAPERPNERARLISKVEQSQLRSFLDVIPDLDCDLARGHFRHPDTHKGHQSDLWVVRLNKDDGSSGDDG